MEKKGVRYLEELGPNLQKIMKRLLANQSLLRYLMYTDSDPLSENKPDIKPEDAYLKGDNGCVRIIPIIGYKDDSKSVITLRVMKGVPSVENSEFLDIYFAIEIFVPAEQWIIIDSNLRPYAIMGEIQKSLANKNINGLGKISGAGFSVNFFTEEMTAFIMQFQITQFN